jgi:hypothetical protein
MVKISSMASVRGAMATFHVRQGRCSISAVQPAAAMAKGFRDGGTQDRDGHGADRARPEGGAEGGGRTRAAQPREHDRGNDSRLLRDSWHPHQTANVQDRGGREVSKHQSENSMESTVGAVKNKDNRR